MINKFNTISYENGDYIINGTSFLRHLEIHEKIDGKAYLPAFTGSSSLGHLLRNRQPDLELGKTSLYLCSHCGGYDGGCIGAEISFAEEKVTWTEIGIYNNFSDETVPHSLFKKVRKYVFKKQNYIEFIALAEKYESPYYG